MLEKCSTKVLFYKLLNLGKMTIKTAAFSFNSFLCNFFKEIIKLFLRFIIWVAFCLLRLRSSNQKPGFPGFRFRSIPTLSLRNSCAAPTIPSAENCQRFWGGISLAASLKNLPFLNAQRMGRIIQAGIDSFYQTLYHIFYFHRFEEFLYLFYRL